MPFGSKKKAKEENTGLAESAVVSVPKNSQEATNVNSKTDYRMLNILGVARTVTTGLRTLHTTFGGFGLLSVATEQLICRINMLLQHHHTSTNLSRKLEASLRYLQLQLGTPHNPLTLDYDKWGHLAPLSWVKMLWRSLHHFNIHLHLEYPSVPNPRERDQVVMELIFGKVTDKKTIILTKNVELRALSLWIINEIIDRIMNSVLQALSQKQRKTHVTSMIYLG